MPKRIVSDALASWRSLNAVIMSMTEKDLETAIEIERGDPTPRSTVLRRLHQRRARLVRERERKELLG